MNFFIIAGIVGVAVIFIGIIVAAIFVRLSVMVKENQAEMEQERTSINTNMTFGFEIPVDADASEQLQQARKLAAKQAAALPRGANQRIGRLGSANMQPASANLDRDPWTATKIATFHSWQGARTGPPAGGTPQQAPAAQTQAAPSKKPEDLVPGEDYEYIEITDDMEPAEKRRARIANAKARSAAAKALKQQAQAAPAQPAAQAAPAQQQQAQPEPAAAAGIPEPDYKEITDDMAADEVRKARIHNAKARSAYYKALKDAGIDPKKVKEGKATASKEQAAAPAQSAPAGEQEEQGVTVPANIEEPDYIEITDDMPADEVRKARVHNSRERSRYYKALKDAGIDPKEVEASKTKTAEKAADTSPDETTASDGSGDGSDGSEVTIPAHIEKPDYVEITDDMSADEVRQARVQNSRERSRFFKALKDAGIDPKKVANQ